MLDAEALRDSVIQRFNLVDHYGIDASEPDWRDQLLKQYFKNIKCNKTLYSSVVISVRDTDPVMAADMANYIAETVNKVHFNMLRATTEEGIRKLSEAIHAKEQQVNRIEDTLRSLKSLNLAAATGTLQNQVKERNNSRSEVLRRLEQLQRNHNITEVNEQLSLYNTELAHARSQYLESSGKVESLEKEKATSSTDSLLRIFRAEREGAQRRTNYYEAEIQKLMDVHTEFTTLHQRLEAENQLLTASEAAFNQLTGEFEPNLLTTQLLVTQDDLEWELAQLNELRRKHEIAQVSLFDPTPAAYLVSPARPTRIKTSPTTLLNTVLAFAFGLFATVVFLFLAERTREGLKKMRPQA
jgi:uncharacterized protein involved in exopolysaccharide biosynthesis